MTSGRQTEEPPEQEQEVARERFLPKRGSSNSPPWFKPRCFVFDTESDKLDVWLEEDIQGTQPSSTICRKLTCSRPNRHPKIPENKTTPTTETH